MASDHRCRLLELPPELRKRIYEYALAPTGSLVLSSSNTNPRGTVPVLATPLLATRSQIHSEAAHIIYAENSICITIERYDGKQRPTITESRLPQRVLEKLQHMTVLLSGTKHHLGGYRDVDWTTFSALISLRTLHIALLSDGGSAAAAEYLKQLLWRNFPFATEVRPEILERILASAKLIYATNVGFEKRGSFNLVAGIWERGRWDKLTVMDASAQELAAIGRKGRKPVGRGCKSGVVEDVFLQHRDNKAM